MYLRRESLRLVIVLLFQTGSYLTEKIACKDENNRNVDWFINYKLPKIRDEPPKSDLCKGTAYAYILAPGSSKWTLSTKNVNSGSMVENTLQNYYDYKRDLTYLLYNDDVPGRKGGTAPGHLKGVVVFDEETGFWLIHSIPNFPNSRKYGYPKSALTYGQMAMCVTFRTSELNEIAHQLLFEHPKIYSRGITEEVEEELDVTARTLFSKKPKFIRKNPFTRQCNLTSLDGVKFISFAKDNQELEDLYSDIIAPTLERSLLVASWRNGAGGKMDKVCEDVSILDIDSINMTFGDKNVFFKTSQDHSKWAISHGKGNNYMCIADLNRMTSQEKRGGGALCFESPDVVSAFDSIIVGDRDQCSKTKTSKKKSGKGGR